MLIFLLIGAGRTKERPGRTLFIRNINYEVSEKRLKGMLEEYGELKRWFNLIEKRGMAFVTFYDSRAAEKAKKRLQGMELNGRSIDVHFALPKEEGFERDEEDDKNTGTLFITFRGSPSVPPNFEISKHFKQWGEVREVRDCKNSPNQKFVEFYDLRDCENAFNENQGAEFGGGILDIKYAFLHGKKDTQQSSRSSYDHQSTVAQPHVGNQYPVNNLQTTNRLYSTQNITDQYIPVNVSNTVLPTGLLQSAPLPTQSYNHMISQTTFPQQIPQILNSNLPTLTQPLAPNINANPNTLTNLNYIPSPAPILNPAPSLAYTQTDNSKDVQRVALDQMSQYAHSLAHGQTNNTIQTSLNVSQIQQLMNLLQSAQAPQQPQQHPQQQQQQMYQPNYQQRY